MPLPKTSERLRPREAKARLKALLRYLPALARLLYQLLRDPGVSALDKTILAAVIAYCINPFDLLPDPIPFLGQVDDIYLIALAVIRMLSRTDSAILNRHWQHEEEVVPLVRELAAVSATLLPGRLRSWLAATLSPGRSQTAA